MSTEDLVMLQAALSALVLGRLHDSHEQPGYYNSLHRAGFIAAVNSGVHYPNVHVPHSLSACSAIARSEIKVKSDVLIEHVTPMGLAFSNGTNLDVDMDSIVYTTSFEKDLHKFIASIVGAEHGAQIVPSPFHPADCAGG
ncbi:hypothetical protein B0H10DRAFT_2221170 [Mycena sp. CBHHK59/15]|nr:hypothetical protein B0H10DRAFT_2221170 [Mycena sp. CBHHK59/15]